MYNFVEHHLPFPFICWFLPYTVCYSATQAARGATCCVTSESWRVNSKACSSKSKSYQGLPTGNRDVEQWPFTSTVSQLHVSMPVYEKSVFVFFVLDMSVSRETFVRQKAKAKPKSQGSTMMSGGKQSCMLLYLTMTIYDFYCLVHL